MPVVAVWRSPLRDDFPETMSDIAMHAASVPGYGRYACLFRIFALINSPAPGSA